LRGWNGGSLRPGNIQSASNQQDGGEGYRQHSGEQIVNFVHWARFAEWPRIFRKRGPVN
jgi:hypothetical protein